VRAQWAARPLVWQPYRQEQNAHQAKMTAFLQRYRGGLVPAAAHALETFWQCWNDGKPDITAAWQGLRAAEPDLTAHAGHWARNLANSGEMAARLVEFVANRVK
jgi:hypothetical protein